MDENKLNPENNSDNQETVKDNVSENTEPEASDNMSAESAEEQNTGETNEYQEFLARSSSEEQTENAENSEIAEAGAEIAEAQTDSGEDEKGKKKSRTKKTNAVLIALTVVLLAATACMVWFLASNNSSRIDLDKVVLSVNGVDSTAGEYIYMYSAVQANYYYYQLTAEQMQQITEEQLAYIDAMYAEAVEKGYAMTDEDHSELDAQMDYIQSYAEAESMNADEYLESSFGKGFTVQKLREYNEKQQVAMKYYNDILAGIEKEYTGENADEKVNEEYAANKKNYDLSDAAYWYIDSSEDGAQETADKIVEQANDGKSFDEAIKAAAGDSASSSKSLKGYTYSTISGNFSEDAADWIFAQDDSGNYTNGKGTATSIAAEGVIYVLYVNNAPARDESVTVTVNYIKVSADEDDTVKSEEELMLSAKSQANKIFDEYNSGTKTEAAFKELLVKYDDGDNELISGDVFEDMKKDGSHDSAVENWAYDSSRKAGDTAVLEGDGCYYIVYFSSKADHPVWYETILSAVYNNAVTSWQEEFVKSYEDSITKDEEAIAEAIEYINSMTASLAS